jgi:two-component system response regulator HydG
MDEEAIHVWFCTADTPFVQLIARALGAEFELHTIEAFNLNGARRQTEWPDVVLLDLRLEAECSGRGEAAFQLMQEIQQFDSPPPMIAILDEDNREMTRRAIENGAYDTLASPPDMVELRMVLRRAQRFRQVERELVRLRSQQATAGSFGDFVISTEPMQRVFALAQRVATCDVSVLITGETGTGKDMLARAIHQLSPRAAGPFVAFSCANLPETLIEDELFGHEKGAFTGAMGTRRGRFEAAHQGSLFLDEIGDLALGLQAKLLRVLQQRSLERLGSNTPINVNIRLLCATHRNLGEMVEQGEFRSDLFYRLNVVEIHIPPLRERRDEIAALGHHFLMRFAKQFGKSVRRFSPVALQALEECSWPGNVRELENAVQRAVVMADGPAIELWHLPKAFCNGWEMQQEECSYDRELREFKRRLILRVLRDCDGSKSEAARRLGIARGYLHRLINQLHIEEVAEESFADLPEICSPVM